MQKNEHSNHGHRDRLRERFLKTGIDSLHDHEILEFLLFYCIPRRDTKNLARNILNTYGTFSNLLDADYKDLIKNLGITKNAAVFLTFLPHVLQKYQCSKWSKYTKITDSDIASEYCKGLFVGKKFETFFVLCLNSSRELIATQEIAEGTVEEVAVHPRKIVEAVIRFNAASVILAHNHPGKTFSASFSDIELTKRIEEALRSIGIMLSDHIIYCGDACFSFLKEGLLD